MAQNWKPVLDEIKNELKTKFSNRDEIRAQVVENLKHTRVTVEKTLKTVAEEAKDSRLVNEIVIPALESERADSALNYLNDRLAATPLAKYDLVSKIRIARKAILNFKSVDKDLEEADSLTQTSAPVESKTPTTPETATSELAAEAKTAAAAFDSETKPKRKSKAPDTLEE